jgi:hypothetical protein
MTELVFEIHDAEEGGYNARALGKAIFTQAEDWQTLKSNVLEALTAFYDSPAEQPQLVTLHYLS